MPKLKDSHRTLANGCGLRAGETHSVNEVSVVAKALAFLALAVPCAHAQDSYPVKPVRFVVPYPPGGSSDVLARVIAQKLTDALGRQVIVENRPGAGGAIATEYVARQPADGYTLLLYSAGPNGILPAMSTKLSYDPLKDFAAITQVVSMPFLIAAHPALPVRSIKDLIALARARPGQLNYGSAGHGSTNHLVNVMLGLAANISLTHVPYKGVSAAMTDAIAGQIQLLSGDLVTILPQVKTGKLRALAVTSAVRSSLIKDVPTMMEAGQKDFDMSGAMGVFAPAATPRPTMERFNAEVTRALALPEVRDGMLRDGFVVSPIGLAEFDAFMRAKVKQIQMIAKAANLKTDY